MRKAYSIVGSVKAGFSVDGLQNNFPQLNYNLTCDIYFIYTHATNL